MGKKDPSRISVVHLCKAAGVNRSTFYAAFGNMEAFVNEIIRDEVLKVCEKSANSTSIPANAGEVPIPVILSYIDEFTSNKALLRFLNSKRGHYYQQVIVNEQVDIALHTMENRMLPYSVYYQNVGVCGTITKWTEGGMPISKEQLAEIIHEFSKAMYI